MVGCFCFANPSGFLFGPSQKGTICSSDGRLIHEQLIQSGCKCDVFVGSSLVYMYAKSGIMQDPWRVFNKMPSQDVVTSIAMILGHVQCRQGQMALELSQQMQQEGV
jgi:hypothetical protein